MKNILFNSNFEKDRIEKIIDNFYRSAKKLVDLIYKLESKYVNEFK